MISPAAVYQSIRLSLAICYRFSRALPHGSHFRTALSVFFLVILSFPALAQETPQDSSSVRLRGSAMLSVDVYDSSSPDTNFRPRLQPFVARAIVRAELMLPAGIILPFEVYVSTMKTTFQQPFNQFGVNPQFGSWLTLHAGFFSMQQSEFTFGDVRLCGGGLELTPGNFRFTAAYGLGRFAREPIAEASYPGEYSRAFFLTSIGYGKLTENNVMLNIAYSADDSTTLTTIDSLRPPPQENLVTSVSFAANPASWLQLSGEVSAAIFTNDTRLPNIDSTIHIPEIFIIEPHVSTQIDGAARFSAGYSPIKEFNIKADAKWVGPGFVTLGWQAMQNDVLDITLAPSARLDDGNLILRASGGIRFNNLRNNRLSPTQRTIGSAFIGWQISPALGLDVQYGNYGLRSAHLNDTLRIQNVFQNLTVSPRISFDWLTGINTLTASYSLQDVDDKNVFSQNFTRSTSHTLTGVHIITLPSTLTFTSAALFTSFSAAGITTTVLSLTESAGQSFWDDALNISATAGVNRIAVQQTDWQFTGTLNGSYFQESIGTFTLTASINSFVAAQLVQSPSFREFFATLSYRTSF